MKKYAQIDMINIIINTYNFKILVFLFETYQKNYYSKRYEITDKRSTKMCNYCV